MIGVSTGTSPYSCYLTLARPLSTPPCFAIRQVSTRDSNPASGCSRCFVPCCATNQQQQRQSRPAKKKTGRRKAPGRMPPDESGDSVEVVPEPENVWSRPSPLPKPPAGFVLDEHGRVLLASSKRITTIIDATNNLPLECVIRRIFQSSAGDECFLLSPLDPPIQILKSTNFEGWSAVDDEEVDAVTPSAAYALAKIHMHLVLSGFCYTARGGFCYSEEDILEFHTDDGEAADGMPAEGLKITCFTMDGTNYMIYTPSDPLLFVAVKDKNGVLRIADDDLLDDPAIISAMDEETEFNALVEEETALLESSMGEG
ncbi:uncharacterized protein LOC122047358 [Zingiber officinale]|uniref:Uncharacterized protein n=1 Tax=Zingiber officinale TaxID=94328 RepID=A0A8J5LUN0_ZINOF|nr:uncharacterized protein LOC122047358 [Zingiber officinale]KAG6526094.1 hypothetical protein ZIOFF_016071 [Zingiber officinale]